MSVVNVIPETTSESLYEQQRAQAEIANSAKYRNLNSEPETEQQEQPDQLEMPELLKCASRPCLASVARQAEPTATAATGDVGEGRVRCDVHRLVTMWAANR